MDVIGPERYVLWVCKDCGEPAHGPGSRCGKDRRRTWTKMVGVEYVRADLHQGAVDLLATFVDDDPCDLDHHGYCQTHNWLEPGECNVARARRLLGGGENTVR